jgi:pimeloyl-ACP methyl ester carboxylesterase
MAAIDTPRPTPHAIVTSLGPVDYVDAGSGPPVLLLHGLHMDHSLWEDVVEDLARDHRCIVPTLPLGAQRQPVLADHLQIVDVAGLIGELLDRLDLQDVTAVGNDTGGAILQLFLRTPSPRLRRIALVACEAFDNLPLGSPAACPPWQPGCRAAFSWPRSRCASNGWLGYPSRGAG